MPITADPPLLIFGAIALSAGVFTRMPAEGRLNIVSYMIGSAWGQAVWAVVKEAWIVCFVAAFLNYASLRTWLTEGADLRRPWPDYAAVLAIAVATYLVRWAWAGLLWQVFLIRRPPRGISSESAGCDT